MSNGPIIAALALSLFFKIYFILRNTFQTETLCALTFSCKTSPARHTFVSVVILSVKNVLENDLLEGAGTLITLPHNNALFPQPAERWQELHVLTCVQQRGLVLTTSQLVPFFSKAKRNGSCRFVSRSYRGQGWVPTSPAVAPHLLTRC